MTAYSSQTYLGGCTLQKTAGQTTFAPVGTAWKIPITSATVYTPTNFVYPPVTAAGAGPTTGSQGKKSPVVTMTFPLRPNFVDTGSAYYYMTMFNELIGGLQTYLDTNKSTSEWAIVLYEPINGQRLISVMKCMGCDFIYNASGGPIMCQLTFCGLYGDVDTNPSPPTVSSFNAPSGGQDYGTADVAITGADQVDGLTISLLRAQAVQQTATGTVYGNAVTSGATGGTVSIAQSYTATTTAPTSISIGTTGNHGINIAFVINLDVPATPWALGRMTTTRSYSLVDFSGSTYTTAFPYLITAL